MQNAFSSQTPPRSQAPLPRFPQGPAQQPPPPSDSVEASQKYTGCADDLPPTPTMSGMPEISLTKPERFTEVRFGPQTRTQGLGSFAPHPPQGGNPYVKSPLQDALSRDARLDPFDGFKQNWPRFSKGWKAYLHKMGVDENTERDSFLVETLRLYIDPSTRLQWATSTFTPTLYANAKNVPRVASRSLCNRAESDKQYAVLVVHSSPVFFRAGGRS